MGCKGYKKNSCWIEPPLSKVLCASCEKQKQYDTVETFLLHQNPSDQELLNSLLSPATRDVYASPLMELLLRKVYASRRHLLQDVLNAIFATNTLYLSFTTIFKQHMHTPICSAFQYIIRKKMYQTGEPINCLHCIGHLILYSQKADSVVYWLHPSKSRIEPLIHSAIYSLKGISLLKHFLYCIVESEYLTNKDNLLRNIFSILSKTNRHVSHNALVDALDQHPLRAIPPFTFLKQRLEPFREEFTAKSWHPSRFIAWCLDTEEQEEFRQPDGSFYQSTVGDHWNFNWNTRF